MPAGFTGHIDLTRTPLATVAGYASWVPLLRTDFPVGSIGAGADWPDDLRASVDGGATWLNVEPTQIDANSAGLWIASDITATVEKSVSIYAGKVGLGPMTLEQRQAVWDANYSSCHHFGDGVTVSFADSTANANDGTNHGGVGVAGPVAGAAYFDGTTYATKISPVGMPLGNGTFTIELWTKCAASAPYGIVFGLSPNTGDAYYAAAVFVNLHGAGIVSLESAYCGVYPGNAISDDLWTHLAIVKTPGTSLISTKFYINSGLQTTYGDDFLPDLHPYRLGFGGGWYSSDGAYPGRGAIAEARVSTIDRSAQIAEDYAQQRPDSPSPAWAKSPWIPEAGGALFERRRLDAMRQQAILIG